MKLCTLLLVTFLNYGELAFQEDNDFEIIDLYCNFEAFNEG
jgi:hypothetical protein